MRHLKRLSPSSGFLHLNGKQIVAAYSPDLPVHTDYWLYKTPHFCDYQ